MARTTRYGTVIDGDETYNLKGELDEDVFIPEEELCSAFDVEPRDVASALYGDSDVEIEIGEERRYRLDH